MLMADGRRVCFDDGKHLLMRVVKKRERNSNSNKQGRRKKEGKTGWRPRLSIDKRTGAHLWRWTDNEDDD